MNRHVRMHHHRPRLGAVPATVKVTISGDPPAVQLSSADIPIQRVGSDYMLTFNNTRNEGDGFDVTFTIDDQTGLGYGFFQDPGRPSLNDAISVKVIGSSGHCPKPGQKWVGFTPKSLPDRQHLIVSNPNKFLQYFGFALYFSLEGETAASLTYDPIGDNQDGVSFD